jgi:hypothetical protein
MVTSSVSKQNHFPYGWTCNDIRFHLRQSDGRLQIHIHYDKVLVTDSKHTTLWRHLVNITAVGCKTQAHSEVRGGGGGKGVGLDLVPSCWTGTPLPPLSLVIPITKSRWTGGPAVGRTRYKVVCLCCFLSFFLHFSSFLTYVIYFGSPDGVVVQGLSLWDGQPINLGDSRQKKDISRYCGAPKLTLLGSTQSTIRRMPWVLSPVNSGRGVKNITVVHPAPSKYFDIYLDFIHLYLPINFIF